ncbi:MAG TPA: DUF202 domain-containing protein [Chitinophaga sp.]|uniref:YidH family protein n=1 Tax=Chitinophaga sp. TaxID=1869181 RepID=UPI002DB6FB06|nr:DUF202 domain-containing protein [Chitinophaga sp.]HEU4555479.1 DUF202 domain-containing protein [Chitinophaga sp.]
MSTQEPLKPVKPAGPSDHLANERTFLAWIRTSIAVMGFGFVVVKFSLFVRQLALVVDRDVRLPGRGYSPVIGILLIAIGAVMSLLAFFRYRKIERQLNGGSFFPSFRLSLLTTIGLLVISVLLIVYLLLSA